VRQRCDNLCQVRMGHRPFPFSQYKFYPRQNDNCERRILIGTSIVRLLWYAHGGAGDSSIQ
jgi:hypothetical protein